MLTHVRSRAQKAGLKYVDHTNQNELKVDEYFLKKGAGGYDGFARIAGENEGETHLVPINVKNRKSTSKKPHIPIAIEVPQETELGKKISTVAHRRASRVAPKTHEKSIEGLGKTPEALAKTRKQSSKAKVKLSRLIGKVGKYKTHSAAIPRRRKLALGAAKELEPLSTSVHIVGDGEHVSVITSDKNPGHAAFLRKTGFNRTGDLDRYMEDSANIVRTERGNKPDKLPTVTHSVSIAVPKQDHRTDAAKKNAEGYISLERKE